MTKRRRELKRNLAEARERWHWAETHPETWGEWSRGYYVGLVQGYEHALAPRFRWFK